MKNNPKNILLKLQLSKNVSMYILFTGIMIMIIIGIIMFVKYGKVKNELKSCRSSRLT